MKSLLIATTALVSVFSLAPVAGMPTRQAASNHHQWDANREFLCNYGYTISTTASISSSYLYDYWLRAAIPVIGKGRKVTEVAVADAPLESSQPYGFSVTIYSSRKNKPFEVPAIGNAGQPQQCGRIDVPISPATMLAKGQKYWIVQTAHEPSLHSGVSYATNALSWLYDKKCTSGGLWQTGSCVSGSCYSLTKWQTISGGVPYARVK